MEKPADKIFLDQYYYDKTQTTINRQYCKLRDCLKTGKPEGKGKDLARAYKLWYECNSFDYNPDFEKDEFYPGDFSNIRICYNCEHWIRGQRRCQVCGCFMDLKSIAWRLFSPDGNTCPLGNW